MHTGPRWRPPPQCGDLRRLCCRDQPQACDWTLRLAVSAAAVGAESVRARLETALADTGAATAARCPGHCAVESI
eukprot:3030950-Prymnesium_polylepis.3